MEISRDELREALARGTKHMKPPQRVSTARHKPLMTPPPSRVKVLRREKREAVFAMLQGTGATMQDICKSLNMVRTQVFPTIKRWESNGIARRVPFSTYYEALKTRLPANDVGA